MRIFYTALFILFITHIRSSNGQIFCDALTDASANLTQKCQTQIENLCKNASYVWKMYDASSHFPISGMGYGAFHDVGNYDECLGIELEDVNGRVLGKQCTYTVALPNPYKTANNRMTQISETDMKMFLDELQHNDVLKLTPRIMTGLDPVIMLTLCLPDQCSSQEIAKYYLWGDLLEPYTIYTNQPCATTETDTDYNWEDIAGITFFCIIGVLIIYSTSYDIFLHKYERKAKHPVFLAFSLYTNGQKLFFINKNTKNQITCLNGMRFISMCWIMAGHGVIVYRSLPLINEPGIDNYLNYWQNQYIGSAVIAVDTFFFLSGFLLAYGTIKTAIRLKPLTQLLGFPMMVIHRYLRLTPAAGVLFLVMVTIFRYLGSGPMWVTIHQNMKRQCTDHWWEFFLYVQNYVSPTDMCLNHTWYLSSDMQMFIIAPLILIPTSMMLKRSFKKTLIGLIVLAILFTAFPMAIQFIDRDIDNSSDYQTHPRLIDYLIGIILGIIMYQYKDKPFAFSRLQNLLIWTFFLLIDLAFIFSFVTVIDQPEHTKNTLFYGLYRPVWCTSLAWMVYSCHYGYGGIINWMLSRPIFQVGARLSYSMYLLHAIIEAYWLAIARSHSYFHDYFIFYNWCGHFIMTLLLSALWVLAFESPMIVIEKWIFGGGARKPRPAKPEPTTPTPELPQPNPA